MARDVLDLEQAHGAALRSNYAEHTAREEQHDEHEEQPDERHPVRRLARDIVLQHDKDRRTDQRPPEGAHAAQNRHDHEIPRLVPAQIVRIGEIVEQCVERAGQADKQAGDDPGQPDVPVDRNAEKPRASLVFADRQQGATKGRAQQRRHDGDRYGERDQDQIIEGLVVAEDVDGGKSQIDRHAVPAGEPVIAAGDRVPAIGDEVKDLTEGDRHHGEVNAPQAHDQQADECGGDGAGDHPDCHADQCARHQIFDREADTVDTEAEIGGVAERQNAGEAQ